MQNYVFFKYFLLGSPYPNYICFSSRVIFLPSIYLCIVALLFLCIIVAQTWDHTTIFQPSFSIKSCILDSCHRYKYFHLVCPSKQLHQAPLSHSFLMGIVKNHWKNGLSLFIPMYHPRLGLVRVAKQSRAKKSLEMKKKKQW